MTVKELIKELEKMPQNKEVRIIAEYYSDDCRANSSAKEVNYEGEYYDKVFIKGWDDPMFL